MKANTRDFNQQVKAAVDVMSELLHDLYQRDPNHETFEQAGIINCKDVVDDFFAHGEAGLALEHILYVIHESDILVPPSIVEAMHHLAKLCKLNPTYTKEHHLKLLAEGNTGLYNLPLSWGIQEQSP